ncbi:MAG TPA: hypothetical protein VNS63_27485 [Blastocatellia bacterium]|nr:hypothetical protein [Blastocatellia bacterium]
MDWSTALTLPKVAMTTASEDGEGRSPSQHSSGVSLAADKNFPSKGPPARAK